MKRTVIAVLFAGIAQVALAGDYSYFCTINNVYQLGDDGLITLSASHTKIMRNERFSVDRRTGVIVGERIPAFRATKHEVLFPGRDGNSFKSYFQDYNFVSYLEVYEYRQGTRKPFVLHDSINIYAGFCE